MTNPTASTFAHVRIFGLAEVGELVLPAWGSVVVALGRRVVGGLETRRFRYGVVVGVFGFPDAVDEGEVVD